MYFADQGAEVIVVARSESAPVAMPIHKNIMNRNKKCISINLKDKQHFQIVKTLITHADIIIDPYRPGVL
jgi:crotonobetainyl-CoA:carnitine CoA-transferase CaiB-like acyl-CoA transferase